MDFNDDVDFCISPIDPSDMLVETEEPVSLIFDDQNLSIKKRSKEVFLKPICIDGLDVSNKYCKMLNKKKSEEEYVGDVEQSILNVKAIAITLWYFISRGHTTVAFLPSNLRDLASKCSDPHVLYEMSKMDLVMFDDHDTNPSELTKTIALCAENSNGCVVGSRKKYSTLAKRLPEIFDIVNVGLIRPIFLPDQSMKTSEKVRKELSIHEVQIHNSEDNPISFQLLASDQIFLMTKLAKILDNKKYIELCVKTRKLNISTVTGSMQLKNAVFNKQNDPKTGSNYHYNDEFLPEYVAPPQPKCSDNKKATRIGNKNSIYRVGGKKNEKSEMDMKMAMKGPLIEALEQLFGMEKAVSLVQNNLECDEINDLIEIGLAQDSVM